MAKLIDGRNVAEKVYAESAQRNRRIEIARADAWPGRCAGRRQSGFARLRALEGQNVPRARVAFGEARTCRTATTQAGIARARRRIESRSDKFTAFSCNRRRRSRSTKPRSFARSIRAKDVDGFHPFNVAKLALGDESGFVPCTPLGCLRLLQRKRRRNFRRPRGCPRPQHDRRQTDGASSHAQRASTRR